MAISGLLEKLGLETKMVKIGVDNKEIVIKS
jgi:hypothetical protein